MSSRSPWSVWPSRLILCLAVVGAGAHAQTAASSSASANAANAAATGPNAQLSDAERAKRDADKVFQWIKFHAEKGETKKPEKHEEAKRPEPKPEPKPVVKTAQAPAPAPITKKPEPEPEAKVAVAPVSDTSAAATVAPSTGAGVPTLAGGSGASAVPSLAGSQATRGAEPAAIAPTTSVAPMTARPEPAVATPPPPVEEENTTLKLIKRVDPEYPRNFLAEQRNGSVQVRFVVQTDGSVEYVEAVRSPDRKLSAAAIKAVQQWRFAPISKARQVNVEIGFQVE